MIWPAVLFIAFFTSPLWGVALFFTLQPRWKQYQDREKNAAGDALADVAIALLNDEPAAWAATGSRSVENTTADLLLSCGYDSATLYANGVEIPISDKAGKALRRARKEWAERKEQERIRQALATVGGKLHAINGGRA